MFIFHKVCDFFTLSHKFCVILLLINPHEVIRKNAVVYTFWHVCTILYLVTEIGE